MLSYFRINDPYRLIIIFILLLLFKLPYLLSPEWNTIPELSWMIIGERMNEGAFLYVDVWDDIGPLSAWVYRTLDFVFDRSHLSFQILGLLLFFFQIFYSSYIALKHKMYKENSYVPALFYGLLGLLFFNIITLSPQMIGVTFILFSINHLFNHVESHNKTDGNLLNIGLYVGIAALFYLPLFIFILVHIIGLVFFTNTIRRRYMLLFYGVCTPFIVSWLIYVWQGEARLFYSNFIHSLFAPQASSFLSLKSILVLSASTIFVFTLASLNTLMGFGFTVFQVRIQKVMFFGSLVALLIFLLYSDRDGNSLILFFPWFSFFLSHFFLKIKKNIRRELGFFAYLLCILAIYFGITFNLFNVHSWIDYQSVLLKQSEIDSNEYAQKRILVLGPNIQPYAIANQATPYFNWSLSKDQLSKLNFYDNLEDINENIRKDMPDYIIDQVELAPVLFDQIPLIGRQYEKIGAGIYKRLTPHN